MLHYISPRNFIKKILILYYVYQATSPCRFARFYPFLVSRQRLIPRKDVLGITLKFTGSMKTPIYVRLWEVLTRFYQFLELRHIKCLPLNLGNIVVWEIGVIFI